MSEDLESQAEANDASVIKLGDCFITVKLEKAPMSSRMSRGASEEMSGGDFYHTPNITTLVSIVFFYSPLFYKNESSSRLI